MKNPEEFLESQEIGNLSIVYYIPKEGYVWKAIVKAMFEYGKDAYNQALEDAAENAEVETVEYHTNDFIKAPSPYGGDILTPCITSHIKKIVNQQSILKLKK